MKSFFLRALTGAVYVILLVGCTVFSPVTSFCFFGLVCAATLWEFGTLMNRHMGASVNRLLNSMAGFVLVAAVWLMVIGGNGIGKMFGIYAGVLLYLLVSELYRKAENPLLNWALAFASQLYVAVPFSLIPLISVSYGDAGLAYNWIYPLALFVFIWCNDTGAYLFGCALHNVFPAKLFPRISPKKSWIGSIGGGLLTLVSAYAVWHFGPESFSLPKWLGFALVVVIFGTWGDLVESLLKRQLGIKDSGNVLPGHGGLLDRFDSALLSIPAVVAYIFMT